MIVAFQDWFEHELISEKLAALTLEQITKLVENLPIFYEWMKHRKFHLLYEAMKAGQRTVAKEVWDSVEASVLACRDALVDAEFQQECTGLQMAAANNEQLDAYQKKWLAHRRDDIVLLLRGEKKDENRNAVTKRRLDLFYEVPQLVDLIDSAYLPSKGEA